MSLEYCKQSQPILSLSGVNDGPECQKRTDVMDVTLRGPSRGKEGLYGKYTSLYRDRWMCAYDVCK